MSNTRGIRLINKLILDFKGTPDRFARDCLSHAMEVREWLEARPMLDLTKSKDPHMAQGRMQSIIDSESSINYRQNHFLFYGCQNPVSQVEFDETVKSFVRVAQHLRDPKYALQLLAYINDIRLLNAIRERFKVIKPEQLHPAVEAVIRQVVESDGLVARDDRWPRFFPIDELPWMQQKDKQVALTGGSRMRSAHVASMMSMLGSGALGLK